MAKTNFQTIDEYIGTFPKNVQGILGNFRQVIQEAAPDARETISYQLPAFRLSGMLVYFAAWKNHIALYPAGGMKAFAKELSRYEVSKGTIKFPMDKPMPLQLIRRIVKYRVKENLERQKNKKKK